MRDRRGLRVEGCVASVPPEGRYHSRVTLALCEGTPGVSPSACSLSVIGSERSGATKPSFMRKARRARLDPHSVKISTSRKGLVGHFLCPGLCLAPNEKCKDAPRVGDL